MGILVRCPNGHVFKVKDKYAGKKGRCPKCEGQVVVTVPDLMSTTSDTIKRSSGEPPKKDPSGSVLEESSIDHASSSGSLLSGSLIRHKTMCRKCGHRDPIWYARCSKCGEYLEHP